MREDEIVSRETIEERKKIFLDLLSSWNKKVNLVQSNSLQDFELRHWGDSLQILRYIKNKNSKVLDLGSGGGFPGIVLGIHGVNVVLTEVIQKKIAFLQEVVRLCCLDNVKIIKDASLFSGKADIITARAFADLEAILGYHQNVSRETSVGIYHKGQSCKQEIKKALEKYAFDCKVCPSQTSKEGVILLISNLLKK